MLAIAFLGEPAQVGLAVGTVLDRRRRRVLVGERTRPQNFRALGLAVALLCALMFGVRDNLVRNASSYSHPPPLLATAATLLGACVVVLAYLLVARRNAAPGALPGVPLPFLAAGLTLGFTYAFLVEGFSHGRVTVVAPLNATQSIWGVVFAAILVGRSELIGRRTVAAGLLIVAGSALIGATR